MMYLHWSPRHTFAFEDVFLSLKSKLHIFHIIVSKCHVQNNSFYKKLVNTQNRCTWYEGGCAKDITHDNHCYKHFNVIEWSYWCTNKCMCESQSNPLGGVQGGDKVEKVSSANDSTNMMVLEVGEGVHFEASKLEAHMLIFIPNYAMAMYYIVLVTKVWVKGLKVNLFAHCFTYWKL